MKPSSGKKIAIVFPHYGLNDVALQNLSSFQRWNPEADVIPCSFADDPQADFLRPVFEKCRRSSHAAWRNADLLLYNTFLARSGDYEKWFLAEWDAYCAISIHDFFRETWEFPAVVSGLVTAAREPDWHWFKDTGRLPKRLRRFACGIKPITASLFSQETLEKMVGLLGKTSLDVFCELRLGTLAAAVGSPPVPNPRSAYDVSWQRLSEVPKTGSIYHPVKYQLPATAPSPQTTWRIFTVIHRESPLIAHFVSYYASAGFTDIHIAAHEDCTKIDWTQLEGMSSARVHRERAFVGAYHCLKDTSIINGLKASWVDETDWSAAADIDEFHEFPRSLPEICATAGDANCVIGTFVDRFAENGQLAPLRSDLSIFEQFPREAAFTRDVLKQPIRKVMLMRGPHPYAAGHHQLYIPFDGCEIEYPEKGKVHHFKWHSGLSNYLEDRFATEDLQVQPRIRADLDRLREYLGRTGGEFPA